MKSGGGWAAAMALVLLVAPRPARAADERELPADEFVLKVAGDAAKILKKTFADKKLAKGEVGQISMPYREKIEPCVRYFDELAAAAQAKQLASAVDQAVKGFTAMGDVAMEGALAGSTAAAGGNLRAADLHLAWSQMGGAHLNGFNVILLAMAEKSSPEARTAVFDAMSTSLATSKTRPRVQQVLQRALAAETREAEKARMAAGLKTLGVPLEQKPPDK